MTIGLENVNSKLHDFQALYEPYQTGWPKSCDTKSLGDQHVCVFSWECMDTQRSSPSPQVVHTHFPYNKY